LTVLPSRATWSAAAEGVDVQFGALVPDTPRGHNNRNAEIWLRDGMEMGSKA